MIIINNIVKNTYINSEGEKLYYALFDFMRNNQKVEISFVGLTPMSTSFLNSSVGALIDEFGVEKFKSLVKPVEITKSQAETLINYLQSIEQLT